MSVCRLLPHSHGISADNSADVALCVIQQLKSVFVLSADIGLFWEVVKEMTGAQRRQLLGFCWGRSRLPANATGQPFTIDSQGGADDQTLPQSHTCSECSSCPASKPVGHAVRQPPNRLGALTELLCCCGGLRLQCFNCIYHGIPPEISSSKGCCAPSKTADLAPTAARVPGRAGIWMVTLRPSLQQLARCRQHCPLTFRLMAVIWRIFARSVRARGWASRR
jgi:hypothetical protein